MLWRAAATLFLCAPLSCRAADNLGVPWSDLTIELNIASSRMGGDNLASNPTCDQGRIDPCRWTTAKNIGFLAESDGSGRLERVEADWSQDDHPGNTAAFREACSAIASLVIPKWSKAQVSAAVSRTMVITNVRGSAPERQQTVSGIRLFGDRNVRSEPTRPGATFLQCGALPDF